MYSILENTLENSYAQGAFNVTCYQQLKAVLATHDALRSPAIIQVGNIAMGFLGKAKDMNNATLKEKSIGAKNIKQMIDSLKDNFSIPAALHADHMKDLETIKMLVQNGFTSVMIDGSHLPFNDNVELTREVVKYAHKTGITVEGELGVLAGAEDDIFSEKSTYTNPMMVADFLKKTGADCLALSYGTKHGVKKGLSIKLRREIVIASRENILHERIEAMLVSHGSSTVPAYIVEDINNLGGKLEGVGGIPLDELDAVIKGGISKINIDTDMRLSITRNVREFLAKSILRDTDPILKSIWNILKENPSEIDFRVFLYPLRDMLTEGTSLGEAGQYIEACIEKAVFEIVSQLIVQFGSVGYANRIKFNTLDEMADMYTRKGI